MLEALPLADPLETLLDVLEYVLSRAAVLDPRTRLNWPLLLALESNVELSLFSYELEPDDVL